MSKNQTTYTSRVPKGVTIKPQRMGFEFNTESTPDFWIHDNAFLTTWMESLSILFPEGEQFFVDSVRHYRNQIDNKDIQKEISGFIGQEAMHSLEHVAFNKYLDEKGLPAEHLEKLVTVLLNTMQKVLPKKDQLAITVGLEHITAMLATLLLENTEECEERRVQIHDSMRNIWMWHAVEETEHKAVAFDLYQAVGGNYFHRSFYMLVATFGLTVVNSYFHFRMLLKSGKMFDIKDTLKGIGLLYGPKGAVTQLIPEWLSFFKPNFHPWDIDNSNLVKQWKDSILKSAKPEYIKKAA